MAFQRAEFVFTSGVDEFVDQRQTIKLRNLDNAVWTSARAIQTRPGYTSLASNGTAPATWDVIAGAPPGGGPQELVGFDGTRSYEYSAAESRWIPGDNLSAVQVTRGTTSLSVNYSDNTNPIGKDPEIGYCNGYYVHTCWNLRENQVYVEDAVTGAIVLTDLQDLPLGRYPKIKCTATKIYIFSYRNTGGGSDLLQYQTIDTAVLPMTISAPATVSLITTAFGGLNLYDVDYNAVTNQFVFTWFHTQSSWYFQVFDSTMTAVSGFNTPFAISGPAPAPAAVSVAWSADGTNIYGALLYTADDSNLHVGMACVQNSNSLPLNFWNQSFETWGLNVPTGAGRGAQVGIVESGTSPLEAYVVATVSDIDTATSNVASFGLAVDGLYSWRVRGAMASAVVQSNTFTRALTMTSRPWMRGSACMVLCLSQAASTYFVMDVQAHGLAAIHPSRGSNPAVPVAHACARIASPPTKNWDKKFRTAGCLSSVVFPSVDHPTTIVTSTQFNTSTLNQIAQRATFDFTWTMSPPARGIGSWVVPNGLPMRVSRFHGCELGILAPPQIFVSEGLAGGSIAAGNYVYQACYAIVTDDGTIIRGPFSDAKGFVNTGGKLASVFVIGPTPTTLGPNAPVNQTTFYTILEIYRTEANGSTLYQVYSSQDTGGIIGGSYYDDSSADSDIVGKTPAYWNGGGFSNVCPPPCAIATRIKDRIWLGGTDEGNTVYFSDVINSSNPATFHDENNLYVDNGGRVTAIAGLDDKTFIFKKNKIFWVSGEPGNSAGNGSSLTTPAELPTGGIGCIDQRSVVVTPDGIMFQSQRGIELIDRSLQVQWIGASVTSSLGAHNVCASLLVADQHQVRFFLEFTTFVLVYDYVIHEWSRFLYSGALISATSWQGLPVWADTSGVISLENAPTADARYLDNGQFITMSFTTDWKHFAGLTGYKRVSKVHILAACQSTPQGVLLSYQTDYKDFTLANTYTWTGTEMAALTVAGRAQISARLSPQKVESFSLGFQTLTMPGFEAGTVGLTLNGLTIEYQTKTAPYPLPSANRR